MFMQIHFYTNVCFTYTYSILHSTNSLEVLHSTHGTEHREEIAFRKSQRLGVSHSAMITHFHCFRWCSQDIPRLQEHKAVLSLLSFSHIIFFYKLLVSANCASQFTLTSKTPICILFDVSAQIRF